jgi:hypothetical protein
MAGCAGVSHGQWVVVICAGTSYRDTPIPSLSVVVGLCETGEQKECCWYRNQESRREGVRDMYPQPTQDALRKAHSKPPREQTSSDRVLLCLAERGNDDGWVSAYHLHSETTHKAASRLSDLRRHEGVEYECRRDPNSPKGRIWTQYRLVRS